jgi:hypothetical protein
MAVLAVSGLPGVALSQTATLSGVVTDVQGRPLAEVEVTLAALEKSARTNDSGAFVLSGLRPGSFELRARRIGFVDYRDTVVVREHDSAVRRLMLRPVQTLTPVEVSAERFMAEFEDNRRLGLGKFLTRAELEPQEHRRLSDILTQIGARSARIGSHAYMVSSRGTILSMKARCASEIEGVADSRNSPNKQAAAVKCSCRVQVYLDEALYYGGRENEMVPDIDRIVPSSVEAVEYYKGPAQTPLRYSRLNSQCGVLVIHTRRTLGRVREP